MTALYMLDTNICIYIMKNHAPSVARHFARCLVGDVIISAITLAELEYGVICSGAQQTNNRRALALLLEDIPVADFNGDAARAYSQVRLASVDRRRDQLDKLIAAHALALNVVLVTNNVKDFQAYPGLRVENWVEEGTTQ